MDILFKNGVILDGQCYQERPSHEAVIHARKPVPREDHEVHMSEVFEDTFLDMDCPGEGRSRKSSLV